MARTLRRLFMAGLHTNAWLTRQPRLAWIEGRVLTPFFVRLTRWIRGDRPVAGTAASLGAEWERLMGSRRSGRVVGSDDTTAYGEIHVQCPLRGTGDVAACHRLMGYDRGLLARSGGRLVVLDSQAEPGRTFCRVAIRPLGADASDLVPAHESAGSEP